MKTQQKTEIPQNTTKPAPFLGKNVISENKIMKNKANLNSSNSTANPCSKVGYNDLQPKTKNGTNPNKANFRNANSPVFQKIKKMENEPNFNESDVAASNCYRNTYNGFYHKIRQKNEPKRTQLKPIKANLRHLFHSDTVFWPVWEDEDVD